jgi:two-component system, LytTR family, response regulator
MKTNLEMITPVIDKATIVLKTKYDYLIIPVEKIAYCEADGSYSKIKLEDGSEVFVSKSLCIIERSLRSAYFIRCHHSWMVNIRKVEKFNRELKILTVLGQNIPVSRRKCCKIMMVLKALNDQL